MSKKVVKSTFTPHVSYETHEESKKREEFEAQEVQLYQDEHVTQPRPLKVNIRIRASQICSDTYKFNAICKNCDYQHECEFLIRAEQELLDESTWATD